MSEYKKPTCPNLFYTCVENEKGATQVVTCWGCNATLVYHTRGEIVSREDALSLAMKNHVKGLAKWGNAPALTLKLAPVEV